MYVVFLTRCVLGYLSFFFFYWLVCVCVCVCVFVFVFGFLCYLCYGLSAWNKLMMMMMMIWMGKNPCVPYRTCGFHMELYRNHLLGECMIHKLRWRYEVESTEESTNKPLPSLTTPRTYWQWLLNAEKKDEWTSKNILGETANALHSALFGTTAKWACQRQRHV